MSCQSDVIKITNLTPEHDGPHCDGDAKYSVMTFV